MTKKIYGVNIFLNDVNFQLKDKSKQVQTRISYSGFFLRLKDAKNFYQSKLKSFDYEKSIVYGKGEVRGRAELFECKIAEDSQIMNHGKTILYQTA